MTAGGGENREFDHEPVRQLAASQIENYRRQPEELISHFNREVSALDGYRGRQVLELLQNADDAGVDADSGCTLHLDLSRARLVVANTGRPFIRKGLTSLVISDCSPKQLDQNRFIGCKGLGFRSILTWTGRPLVSSGSFEVLFDRTGAEERVRELSADPEIGAIVMPFKEATGAWPAAVMRFPEVPDDSDEWLQTARAFRSRGFSTVVVLPLLPDSRGDIVYQDMVEQVSGVPTSALLFCRHLTRVEISGDQNAAWDLLREDHPDGHATVVLQHNGASELWHVYRRVGQASSSSANTGSRRDFEVAVAVPETARPEPVDSLCVFFPTHERLPCSVVMHATLETTDDRNRLVNHPLNREVLVHLARHVAEIIEGHASPSTPARALELLSGVEDCDPELQELGFLDALVQECSRRSIFPRLDGALGAATAVYKAPHVVWLTVLAPEVFPEVLALDPSGPGSGLLKLFNLPWFELAALKERLKRYLSSTEPGRAGEIVGCLLQDRQLDGVGADGLLVGREGTLIEGGVAFFSPVETLPPLPAWATNVRFVDDVFQAGLLRGSRAASLRALASDLGRYGCEVEEFRFETVARALIEQVEELAKADSPGSTGRWQELLRWIFDASPDARQVLPQLAIKVVTAHGTLRRATKCYLGPSYPRGRVIWRLYGAFDQDEFVGTVVECGLAGLAADQVEEFLLALGVSDTPRLEALRLGEAYDTFERAVLDRLEYPRTIRGQMCEDVAALLRWCTRYSIEGLRLPDRWVKLLTEGDPVALVAFLVSSGSQYLTSETDLQAKFQATVELERTDRTDPSVPILNPVLFFLRETAWVPVLDGSRRRPAEIMLSGQGVRVLRGIYSRHSGGL